MPSAGAKATRSKKARMEPAHAEVSPLDTAAIKPDMSPIEGIACIGAVKPDTPAKVAPAAAAGYLIALP
jgi:hypothetical protein